jgi:hypothetical protein
MEGREEDRPIESKHATFWFQRLPKSAIWVHNNLLVLIVGEQC